MKKPNHKVFTLAAEFLFNASRTDKAISLGYSRYACDCISDARSELFGPIDYSPLPPLKTTPEQQFFEENFKPQKPYSCYGWWKASGTYENNFEGHDWESRILALLLCAEMLKSEKR